VLTLVDFDEQMVKEYLEQQGFTVRLRVRFFKTRGYSDIDVFAINLTEGNGEAEKRLEANVCMHIATKSLLCVNLSRQSFRGVRLPYCWKCGTELKEDARFCHKCGAPVRHARKEKERPWWEELEDSFEDFGERMEKWWEELWD